MKSPCLDCGTPTDTTRCQTCAPNFNRARQSQQERERKANGGRPQYAGQWATYARAVRTNATHCWICGNGPTQGDPFQADHITPVFNGGGRGTPTAAAAHRSCNIGRSNKLRAGKPDPAPPHTQQRRGHPTPPTPPPHTTPHTHTQPTNKTNKQQHDQTDHPQKT